MMLLNPLFRVLLISLLFFSCTLQQREARTKQEHLHPARYLKAKILATERLDSNSCLLKARLRNRARYTAYEDPTLLYFNISAEGDTVDHTGAVFPMSLQPHRRVRVCDTVFIHAKAERIRVDFLSGQAK